MPEREPVAILPGFTGSIARSRGGTMPSRLTLGEMMRDATRRREARRGEAGEAIGCVRRTGEHVWSTARPGRQLDSTQRETTAAPSS